MKEIEIVVLLIVGGISGIIRVRVSRKYYLTDLILRGRYMLVRNSIMIIKGWQLGKYYLVYIEIISRRCILNTPKCVISMVLYPHIPKLSIVMGRKTIFLEPLPIYIDVVVREKYTPLIILLVVRDEQGKCIPCVMSGTTLGKP